MNDINKSNEDSSNIEENKHYSEVVKGKKPPFYKRLFIFGSTPLVLANCLGLILASGLLLWLSFGLLKCYTQHNKTYEVPNFVGLHIDEVLEGAKSSRFEIVINDTIDVRELSPHLFNKIAQQDPQPQARAKNGRRIYLKVYDSYISSVKIEDKLYGIPFEDITSYLDDLRIGHKIVEEVIGEASGTIREVRYKGKVMEDKNTDFDNFKGYKVQIGDSLEFVVVKKYDSGPTQIPDLMCLTYKEALFKLRGGHNLMLGNLTVDASVVDTATAYVVAQFPQYYPGKFVNVGDQIDIRLSQTKPTNCTNANRGEKPANDVVPNNISDPEGRWD